MLDGLSPLGSQHAGRPESRRFLKTRPAAAHLGAEDCNEMEVVTMSDNLSLSELNDRIAILRDNLRQLVEQAAGASGSQNEERIADRIAQQSAELDKLIAQRDARAAK
jgi:uncharacterized small protein (DUF1192 family)